MYYENDKDTGPIVVVAKKYIKYECYERNLHLVTYTNHTG